MGASLMSLSRALPVLRRAAPALLRAPAPVRPALAVRSGLVLSRWMGDSSFIAKETVTERVIAVVKGFDRVEPAKVTATSHFMNDLGLDSLDTVELLMAVEEEFSVHIPDADAEKIHSTQDAIEYIASHPQAV